MGGKSGKQTIGYKYYLGMHLGLCHGPIDAVKKLSVDNRTAWEGSNTGGAIVVDKPELFGGEKREGGVSGTIDFEGGEPDQAQNSYLLAQLGALIPAYRGIAALVFRQCYLGNNPYLKTWAARCQRVHVRQDGLTQWYDEKAGIPVFAQVFEETTRPAITTVLAALAWFKLRLGSGDTIKAPAVATYNFDLNSVTNAATSGSGAAAVGVSIEADPGSLVVITPNHSGPYVAWSPWGTPSPANVPAHTGSVWRLNVMYDDNPSDTDDIWDGGTYSGYAAARAGFEAEYPGGFTIGAASKYTFYLEDSPILDNSGGVSFTVSVYPASFVDMNPSHIIRECLTDPDWGMGYTDDDIDDVSFMAAADTFYAEGLGMSLLWDRQVKIEEFVQQVQKHVDAALYVSRSTGKFVLKAIRNDYDEGSLISLDESNIVDITNPSRVAFGELTNSVTVNYWDSATGKDASITVSDPALAKQQGVVINAPMQYPGITNERNATIIAHRDLRVLSSPLMSCTITANSDAKPLNLGDTFKLSWARWGLVDVVMRVTDIAYGTGRNNRVKITCSEDIFDTDATNVIVVVPDTDWTDPSVPPSAVPEQLATEAPYYELVQALGQSDTDNKLLTHPEIGYVIAAAGTSVAAINANLHTDSGSGYEDAGTLDFAPFAYLAADIGKTDTSFTIANGSDLEVVPTGTHVQVGDELMRVDTLDPDTGAVTVGRGVLDTVPQAHTEGAVAMFWDNYAGFDPTEYVITEDVAVKITPVSGAGTLPIDDAVPMSVEIAARAARPYAPGDLRINGDSYQPEAFYDGEVAITWTHRNRILQTAGGLIDHTAGDIGPEAGVVYRVRGYINDVLVHTEDDIAGNSATWTPLIISLNIRVEVHAKRDGLYSWQAPSHTFTNVSSGPMVTEDGDERFDEDSGDQRYSED